jgi:hypothetical protein
LRWVFIHAILSHQARAAVGASVKDSMNFSTMRFTQTARKASCWLPGLAGHAAARPADGFHARDMPTSAAASPLFVCSSCEGVFAAFVEGGLVLRRAE